MGYTTKSKRQSWAKEGNRIKWQKKTATGTSGLSFNNLTVGKKYKVTVNWRGTGGDANKCFLWNLSGAFTINGGSTYAGVHTNEDRSSGTQISIFTAATTTLTLNRVADAWGTDPVAFDVFLEEFNNDDEVTEWT